MQRVSWFSLDTTIFIFLVYAFETNVVSLPWSGLFVKDLRTKQDIACEFVV